MKNILLIGLGSAGKKHVDALENLKVLARIFAFRSNANNAPVYKSVINIFDLNNLPAHIDFAIIANPTSQHYNWIEKLLDLNIPLFIEKPAVSSISEGENILKEKSFNNVQTYVGCNLRFLEVLKFTQHFLAKSKLRINEVNIYGGSDLSQWRPHQDFRKSYSANEKLGGGIHLDWIHELDYLYWLFGYPNNTVRVFGQKSSLNINAIDYANYIFTYPDFHASVILNYYRKDRKRTLEIVAEEGTLLVEIEKGHVYFKGDLIFSTKQSILATYTQQMDYFLKNLTDNQPSMNTFADALQVLKMCLPHEKA